MDIFGLKYLGHKIVLDYHNFGIIFSLKYRVRLVDIYIVTNVVYNSVGQAISAKFVIGSGIRTRSTSHYCGDLLLRSSVTGSPRSQESVLTKVRFITTLPNPFGY